MKYSPAFRMKILFAIIGLILFTALNAHAGAITCKYSEVEIRPAHNEGDESRLGSKVGEVPRYFLRNGACVTLGRFAIRAELNTVVGQKWTTVHQLGAGADAIFNTDTYLKDLSAHHYLDAEFVLGHLAAWETTLKFRNSIYSNVVSDHFGIILRRNW